MKTKLDSIKENLYDAGFNKEETEKFIEYEECQNWKCQCICLDKKRKQLLDDVHRSEKQITNLDYLKYKLEKERK